MANPEINNHYSDLISRYLSGNASDAQVAELEAWVMADPENKEQFIAFKKAWMLAGMEQEIETIDVEAAWQKTAGELFDQGKVVEMRPKSNRRVWLSIAAAIALIFVASFWFLRNNGVEEPMFVQANEEIQSFDLADGSKITLNQASTLSYSVDEETGQRKVELDGDAFFEVARDEARPFVIQTQMIEVEVLGTSFYVDSRKDLDEIQVIVKSGKVAVRSDSAEEILIADEKAVYDKNSGKLTKIVNRDVNYMSIRSDTLKFEDTRLEDVAFALNRRYKSKISIQSEELKDCPFNGVYPNRSLEFILQIIELGNPKVRIERRGEEIILTGECQDKNSSD